MISAPVAWLGGDQFSIYIFGIFRSLLTRQSFSEVELRLEAIGIQLKRAPLLRLGFFRLTFGEQSRAQWKRFSTEAASHSSRCHE